MSVGFEFGVDLKFHGFEDENDLKLSGLRVKKMVDG
jgi:hypothetical protein